MVNFMSFIQMLPDILQDNEPDSMELGCPQQLLADNTVASEDDDVIM